MERPRRPLTKDRILRAAVALADRSGLDSLTMRQLGGELGVEAMSLYKHVANKDEILNGIVDLVVGEIDIPEAGSDWKTAMRERAVSAREVLRRHPWAIGLFESRGAARPSVFRYLDAIIARLRAGGFSMEAAGHAFWVLDSYVYGHVIQETSLATEPFLEHLENDDYPHLTELVALQEASSVFDYESAFESGLNLVLDALDALRAEP